MRTHCTPTERDLIAVVLGELLRQREEPAGTRPLVYSDSIDWDAQVMIDGDINILEVVRAVARHLGLAEGQEPCTVSPLSQTETLTYLAERGRTLLVEPLHYDRREV